jgi:hypothetical protein
MLANGRWDLTWRLKGKKNESLYLEHRKSGNVSERTDPIDRNFDSNFGFKTLQNSVTNISVSVTVLPIVECRLVGRVAQSV